MIQTGTLEKPSISIYLDSLPSKVFFRDLSKIFPRQQIESKQMVCREHFSAENIFE